MPTRPSRETRDNRVSTVWAENVQRECVVLVRFVSEENGVAGEDVLVVVAVDFGLERLLHWPPCERHDDGERLPPDTGPPLH